VDVGLTKVKSLKVGGIEIADQLFYVISLESLSDVEGVDLTGLIGFEVFKRFVVSIDYAEHQLTLHRQDHFSPPKNATRIPLTFQGHTPHVQAELDGISGVFTIDTGSRGVITLHSPFVTQHDLISKYNARTDALTGWGVGGGVRSRLARATQFQMGEISVPNPRIDLFVGDKGSFADRYTAGNVGSGLLKRFTVTFDYKNKWMYLEPNRNFNLGDPHDKTGMWINRGAGHFEVMDVVKGGPAARAGIKIGDQITAIDGKPIADLTLMRAREMFKTTPDGTTVRLAIKTGKKKRTVRLKLRAPL
jgi:hypothetical protein